MAHISAVFIYRKKLKLNIKQFNLRRRIVAVFNFHRIIAFFSGVSRQNFQPRIGCRFGIDFLLASIPTWLSFFFQ